MIMVALKSDNAKNYRFDVQTPILKITIANILVQIFVIFLLL